MAAQGKNFAGFGFYAKFRLRNTPAEKNIQIGPTLVNPPPFDQKKSLRKTPKWQYRQFSARFSRAPLYQKTIITRGGSSRGGSRPPTRSKNLHFWIESRRSERPSYVHDTLAIKCSERGKKCSLQRPGQMRKSRVTLG